MHAPFERSNLTAISGMVFHQSLLMIFGTFYVFSSVWYMEGQMRRATLS